MMGTPAYMAPEQVLGEDIDARADLYAMGVVLYHLADGKLPFKGHTPFEMAAVAAPRPAHAGARPCAPSFRRGSRQVLAMARSLASRSAGFRARRPSVRRCVAAWRTCRSRWRRRCRFRRSSSPRQCRARWRCRRSGSGCVRRRAGARARTSALSPNRRGGRAFQTRFRRRLRSDALDAAGDGRCTPVAPTTVADSTRSCTPKRAAAAAHQPPAHLD